MPDALGLHIPKGKSHGPWKWKWPTKSLYLINMIQAFKQYFCSTLDQHRSNEHTHIYIYMYDIYIYTAHAKKKHGFPVFLTCSLNRTQMIFPPSGSNSSKPPTWHIAGGSIHGGTPRWMIWGYPPWLRKPPSKWGSSITGGITHLNGMHPPSTVSKKGRTNQAFHRELADVCCWRIHTTVFFA